MYGGGVGYGTAPAAYHNGSGTAGSRKRRERPQSTGSKLLTEKENEEFKEVLGGDRVSLCAGIVQLLRTTREDPWSWRKAHTGIVSLVKDYSRRTYVLVLFNIETLDQLWEQVL